MNITIYESQKSEKVIKFLSAETPEGLFYQLLEYTNKRQAKKIIKGIKLNIVWGVYLNKQGKLRVNWN